MPQFSDTELTAAVIDSFEEVKDPRVKYLMEELVKSLHDFVRKTNLSFGEWEYADRFPDPRRPEVHAKPAGIHPAVGRASASRCWWTPSTIARARVRRRRRCWGRSTSASTRSCRTAPTFPRTFPGDRMFVQGRVTDLSGKPLANVPVDVWHADDDGWYDLQKTGI